jgi:redox-sensitive bicupin YhaK (pirin superfamily)
MPIQFSPLAAARNTGSGAFSVKAVDLDALCAPGSPIAVLDDFRVRGRPFPPHPHAGFSAVTYAFEDSKSGLRSRDSLGNDVIVGPGGIVWTEAGSGVMHEEQPADPDGELHGLQIFVNLSAKNKLTPPRMLRLATVDVPERRSEAGDHVRVVVGAFGGVSSPLVPAEPFTLLDVKLQREISLPVKAGHLTLAYVLDGEVSIGAEGRQETLSAGQALALYGGVGSVIFASTKRAHVVIMGGPEINEPVLSQGAFIMNDQAQIEAAVARYRSGAMGRLEPLRQ